VLEATDGDLLLLGRSGSDGWIAGINDSGKTLWEQRLGAKGVAVILDGYPSDGGSFAVLGSYESTPSAPATWIGRFNSHGELQSEIRLIGSANGIASSADGTTIIIGERASPQGKDIWARLLTAGLEDKRVITVLSKVKGVFPFKSTCFAGGGWFVVGSDGEYLPWVGYISREGDLRWTETRRFEPRLVPIVGRSDVLSDGADIFALFTLAMLNEKGEQRQTVRVVQFSAR